MRAGIAITATAALMAGVLLGLCFRLRELPPSMIHQKEDPTQLPPAVAINPNFSDADARELARSRRLIGELKSTVNELSNNAAWFNAENQLLRKRTPTPGEIIGPISLGMTSAELVRTLGPASSVSGPHDGRTIFNYTNAGITVHCDSNNLVTAVNCFVGSPAKTPEGLGIGSSAADIIAAMGIPQTMLTDGNGATHYQYSERGRFFVTGVDGLVVHFAISRPKPGMFADLRRQLEQKSRAQLDPISK